MTVTKSKTLIFLLIVISIGMCLRFFDLDWDQGQHLHPDERFLTMVTTSIKIPSTFAQYLNPQISTMNPYNVGYGFFVYGTFPMYLTKLIGELTGFKDYANVHFVGRILSAFFDLGVIFLVFKIGKKIGGKKQGLWAAYLYSIMVLPIQLSHFYAVDTFLNFFIVLSFYFLILLLSQNLLLITNCLLLSSAIGIAFGLALACKISALHFLPIIGIGYLYQLITFRKSPKFFKAFTLIIISGLVFFSVAVLVFRINQPTVFFSGNFFNWQVNPRFLANLKELRSWGKMDSWFPPDVYWMSRQGFGFAPQNIAIWCLGLPIAITILLALLYHVVYFLKEKINKRKISWKMFGILLISTWVTAFTIYQNLQFAKNMRYFFIIYPFLALLGGSFLGKINLKTHKSLYIFIGYVAVTLFWPLSFLSIYTHPITRVQASKWIYANIPPGKTIACEHWDDCLPVGIDSQRYPQIYQYTEGLPLYDAETPEKWQKVNDILARSDYIILSSNRLYGSIPRFPKRYPKSAKYYENLLKDNLEFKKVAEFTSRPCFPPIGKPLICFNDDWAEETFTVYDHPKVLIFKKK